jgi:hypothetical protein
MARAMETDMRLIGQPAVLKWFPLQVRTVRFGEKMVPQPERKRFETVAAAIRFVETELSARDNPEIKTDDGVALGWDSIQDMLRGLP